MAPVHTKEKHMPEEAIEATPAEELGVSSEATLDPEAPATDSPQEESQPAVDWEKRYNDQRSEFDRRGTLLAALEGRNGPEAQAQALQQLGVEFEMGEEPEDEWLDPEDRIESLEQKLAQREEAEKQAEFQHLEEQYIDSTLSEIEGNENVKLSDREAKVVVSNALANRLPDGRPDLQGAFDDLKGIKSAARDEYLASKKAPKAPVGTAGEKKIDLSDDEARQKYMAEVMEAEGSE